ncbi:hypothetical protein CspeluHIS016_0802230 [Cutaneotrichosporon spelunceum]|uniref:Man1/Src1 C-terminal domain-containing protein n=1 Tax=Cutaneotrichosporon spelunceum TaxID=1672016 RepID=A0AAD3YF56_9TREE|nr:hypothetical protein CspeluHIS016_0802230 [Cutaneotrichosporon spelunceum]
MSAPARDIYLAHGFDPASLRVPQLRSILHEHNVRHPSSAKKADLIALFISQVQPRAAAILAQDARVRPSARGIVAVSSTGAEAPVTPVTGKRPRARPRKAAMSAAEDLKSEEDAAEAPAKRTRSRRSTVDIADEQPAPTLAPKKRGRPSKKAKETEVDDEGDVKMEDIQEPPSPPPPPKQRRKSAKPEVSARVSREPAAESRVVPATAPAAVRKPRKSVLPDHQREEHMTPQRQRRSSNLASDSSPFSDYNPFQAGSAEAAEVVRRRRKSSLGLGEGKRRAPRPSEWTATSQPSASILRKVGPSNEDLRSPAPSAKVAYADEVAEADAYNAVVERKFGEVTKKETGEPEITVTTTTQAAERLEKEKRPKGKAIIRRKPQKNRSAPLLSLFGILLFLLAAHYKIMSASNGFCDNDTTTNSVILSRELPIKAAQDCITQRSQGWSESGSTECDLQALPLVPFLPRPQKCVQCPVNAQCVGGEVIACDPEYILQPSLLAPLSPLFDGWPMLPSRVFPPKCKPDTARMRQIGQLATQVERFLAQRRGTIECANAAVDLTVGPGVRYGVSESELLNMFAERRVDTIDREDFDDMFKRAVSDLVTHKELIESIDEYGTSYYTSARSEMSIGCRAKLHALKQLDIWKSQLSSTVVIIALIFAIRNRLEASRTERKQVREYTEMAVRRLQDQEYRHYTDPVQNPTPYMPAAQLRDVILPASLGQGAKQRIWSKVEAKVEENANVLVREREVRGDVWKTWEWNAIGGGRAVEPSRSPSSAPAIENRTPAF